MVQTLTEGTTHFTTDSATKISADMPVFYNPVMKRNRDLTLAMLAAMPTWMRAPLRIALPLEASGIRAARILNELVRPGVLVPASIAVNDRSASAIEFARENCERNRGDYPADRIACSGMDANAFLRALGGAEYVDIDPFGTPNPFLDAAVQAVTRGGILAVTATDTSALAGTYPRATARKYWAAPSRTWGMHEWGLRILIRKIQLIAAQHDRVLTPVLSLATDHYYRIFFRNDGSSATRISAMLASHGLVRVDAATLAVLTTTETAGAAGPLWLGPLHDLEVVRTMRGALSRLDPAVFADLTKLLAIVEDEARVGALGFIDLHELSSTLGVQCPRRDAVLERLGERAGRTHLCGSGIVTHAPIGEVTAVVREIAMQREPV